MIVIFLPAADRGVRIYTIGIDTRHSAAINNGNPSGSLIPDTGRGFVMKQNGDDTLQKIAAMTSGKYYTSESATELEKIFAGLSHIQVRSVEAQEISVVFCALGALLVRAAILFAQMWRPFL